MAYYKATKQDFESVADAIREKTGRSAKLDFPTEFVSEIGSISGGGGGCDAMPPFQITNVGWIIIGELGKIESPANTYPMIPMNADESQLDFNSGNSHKIGISVKMSSLANHTVIVSYVDSSYGVSPSIEFRSTGSVGFGIPGGGQSFSGYVELGQYNAGEWLYAEYEYKKELGKVVCRITNDFLNYTSEERTLTPFGTDSCKVKISGMQYHNGGTPYIDFTNTFIESEGEIIWGKFTGAFPD